MKKLLCLIRQKKYIGLLGERYVYASAEKAHAIQMKFAQKGRKWPKGVQRDFGEGKKTVVAIGKIGVQPVCNAGDFKLF